MQRASRFRQIVCGVDEAGRGPLAGPVVVAAVVLPRDQRIDGLADSKTLSAAMRDALFERIVSEAIVASVSVGPRRIDAMNIRAATLWGMAQAVNALSLAPTVALVDGRDRPPGLLVPARAVVGGDRKSSAIAAASIVAKVTRDRLMARLAAVAPEYGFERNKGYPTREHRAALAALGPSSHHRLSFAPVRDAAAKVRPGPAPAVTAA